MISLISVTSDRVDYQLPQGPLVFSVGNQRVCINIELIEDFLVEGEEHFTVMLTSTDQRITLNLNSASISIADNSGKHCYYTMFCVHV